MSDFRQPGYSVEHQGFAGKSHLFGIALKASLAPYTYIVPRFRVRGQWFWTPSRRWKKRGPEVVRPGFHCDGSWNVAWGMDWDLQAKMNQGGQSQFTISGRHWMALTWTIAARVHMYDPLGPGERA